jgi:hypothetical protein
MPRTPAERAIYEAERPIYAASAGLDKLLSQLRAFRSGLAEIILPIAAANDRLDHTEDLAAILTSQLHSASAIIDGELERLQAAEEARHAVREDRAVDADFTRWEASLRRTDAAVSGDEALARLVAGLRSGVA